MVACAAATGERMVQQARKALPDRQADTQPLRPVPARVADLVELFEDARQLFAKLLATLTAMHAAGVAHGDVGIFMPVVMTWIATDRDLCVGQHDVQRDAE